MANRQNVLEKFSSKFKTNRRFHDEFTGGGKKRKKDFDLQRKAKNQQWEDDDES